MARYLVLWEVDVSKVPVDMKERAAAWSVMMDMVRQEIARGTTTDWGAFVGELRGYSVSEQESVVELGKELQRFVPWLNFTVHQVMSLDELAGVIKAMSE